ncbi:hypothetical protein [Aliirhizobium cellulosilyticum]|uniref:Uncharacterized protein n=1 Tax=Aliirhizobium cellulosilyticum TaxID=393664 RepID=A0A7W6UZ93_9HYPH|nr:hypothetical protein [Rhizobium cellulosilyticum]MBB4349335.1 hypothetical protein [Rhizobium cellulosilyticum]MBB4412443.1 hypothetical protein [Rhizobium cellulosilyticum]MBB4447075.1 hypothetical protein [Rhizobium cellulosilyticum]
MKTQQRKFVVEIKGRRRSAVPPKSIWGYTDFSALAKEAEAEAPELFGAEPSIEVVADFPDPMQTTDPLPGVDTRAETIPDEADLVAAMPEQTPFNPVRSNSEIPRRRKKRAKQSHGKAASVRSKSVTMQTLRVSASDVSDHDIEMIIAENQQLRDSWRHQLARENEMLTQMLARFSAD